MEQEEQKAKTLECPKCKSHRIVRELKSATKNYLLKALFALVFAPVRIANEYVFRCKDCGWQDYFMPE
jgi:DNA-directed RNA polymerase subunit RPC12/RpoP